MPHPHLPLVLIGGRRGRVSMNRRPTVSKVRGTSLVAEYLLEEVSKVAMRIIKTAQGQARGKDNQDGDAE